MNEKSNPEPTAQEMLTAIYKNIVWQKCPKCGKRFKNERGYDACYDCSQGGGGQKPQANNVPKEQTGAEIIKETEILDF